MASVDATPPIEILRFASIIYLLHYQVSDKAGYNYPVCACAAQGQSDWSYIMYNIIVACVYLNFM